MLMEMYYKYYRENSGSKYWLEEKSIPYMVLFSSVDDMHDFMRILKADGLQCVSSNRCYRALLVNLELMRFGVIFRACKHSCVDNRNYTPEEFVEEIYKPWKEKGGCEQNWKQSNLLLNEAICYAVECHKEQMRKGSNKPYILHPLETMNILASMRADNDLLMAGVLHDTLEDTEATADDIVARFGAEVGRLVCFHSEDKSRTWEERKQTAIKELCEATKRMKMLVMADKVANLRSMYIDYKECGEEFWNRFNASKEKQAWYYSGIQDALYDMQNDTNTSKIYWEMVSLYKELFVEYYFEQAGQCLYQVSVAGEAYQLKKGNPEWKSIVWKDIDLRGAVRVSKRDAEELEDRWYIEGEKMY